MAAGHGRSLPQHRPGAGQLSRAVGRREAWGGVPLVSATCTLRQDRHPVPGDGNRPVREFLAWLRTSVRPGLGTLGESLPSGRRVERRANPAGGLRAVREHRRSRLDRRSSSGLWRVLLDQWRHLAPRAQEGLLHVWCPRPVHADYSVARAGRRASGTLQGSGGRPRKSQERLGTPHESGAQQALSQTRNARLSPRRAPMKRTLVVALLGLLASSRAWAQTTRAAEQDIIKLEQTVTDAQFKKDRAALERLLADDYLYTHSNGSVLNKAQEIAESMSSDVQWTDSKFADLKVRIFGDVAVLTGRQTIQGTAKGYVPGPRRITDISGAAAGSGRGAKRRSRRRSTTHPHSRHRVWRPSRPR